MIAARDKKNAMDQLLTSLVKRAWLKSAHSDEIRAAEDVPAVVARLHKAGHVSDGVARTILRRHASAAEKSQTYDTVIDKHVKKLPAESPKKQLPNWM